MEDSRFTAGIWRTDMAPDPVNVVYGLIPKAFPLTISGCRADISSLGEARMQHMIEICGGSVESSVFTLGDVYSSQGEMCIGRERMRIDAGGHRYTEYCIVPDGTPAPYNHGARAYGCHGKVYYAERKKALADGVMHLCQNRIAARIMTVDDRTSRLISTYYRGGGVRQSWMLYDPSVFAGDCCISQDSTLGFRRLMYAVACLRGDASCLDQGRRILMPQKHKPAELLELQSSSLLNGYFAELDLDADIKKEWLDAVESSFTDNVEAGYIVPLKEYGVALRFRKIGNFHFGGVYFTYSRDIVLSPEFPESFSHEYGHALFHTFSQSDDPDFLECHRRYVQLLRADPVVSGYDNLSYYLSRTEAFARMYERFVYMRTGATSIVGRAEDRVHPRDPLLDGLTDRYFTAFLSRLYRCRS